MESYPSHSSLGRQRTTQTHDPDARPPALPRMHSHALRPRQPRVQKKSVCGGDLRKKVAMRRS